MRYSVVTVLAAFVLLKLGLTGELSKVLAVH